MVCLFLCPIAARIRCLSFYQLRLCVHSIKVKGFFDIALMISVQVGKLWPKFQLPFMIRFNQHTNFKGYTHKLMFNRHACFSIICIVFHWTLDYDFFHDRTYNFRFEFYIKMYNHVATTLDYNVCPAIRTVSKLNLSMLYSNLCCIIQCLTTLVFCT